MHPPRSPIRRFGQVLAVLVILAVLVPSKAGAGPPYSVTLAASATTLPIGGEVTLVATANQEIVSPYGIVVVDDDGRNAVSCFGAWTVCDSFPIGWDEDKTVTYTAKIVDNTNTVVLATSNPVTVTWGAGSSSDDGATPVAPTDRVAGTNRYETATQISRFWTTATVVYVATGANFPDALAGGPAAAAEEAPILLVEQGAIPTSTATELERLAPSRIVLLGGTAAISEAVRSQLGAYAATVDRVAGVNRYATAASVAAYAFGAPESTVYVASGRSFADPIIAGAAAALDEAPLLLVDGLGPLEAEVRTQLARLQPTEIVLVGPGTAFTGVAASLADFASLTRVDDADIYARSAALWDDVPAPIAEVVLATSNAFADALAGTPYASLEPVSYLMLSSTSCVPAVVRAQMERLQPTSVRLLGGTAALSTGIETQTTC